MVPLFVICEMLETSVPSTGSFSWIIVMKPSCYTVVFTEAKRHQRRPKPCVTTRNKTPENFSNFSVVSDSHGNATGRRVMNGFRLNDYARSRLRHEIFALCCPNERSGPCVIDNFRDGRCLLEVRAFQRSRYASVIFLSIRLTSPTDIQTGITLIGT